MAINAGTTVVDRMLAQFRRAFDDYLMVRMVTREYETSYCGPGSPDAGYAVRDIDILRHALGNRRANIPRGSDLRD